MSLFDTYLRTATRRVDLARDLGSGPAARQHLRVAIEMLEGAIREDEFREAHERVTNDTERRYSSERDLRTLDWEVTRS